MSDERLRAAIVTAKARVEPLFRQAENAYMAIDSARLVPVIELHLSYLWAALDDEPAAQIEQ